MRIIPTRIHGILDYVGSLFLIFSPTIFMFNGLGGAAVITPIIVGVALFISSLLTRYEFGVLRLISFPLHLIIDFFAGAFLALSPYLLGYIDNPPHVWVPSVVVGLLVLLGVLFSKTIPETDFPVDTPSRL